MFATFLCFGVLTVISVVYNAELPAVLHNSLKDDLSGELDTRWVWPSSNDRGSKHLNFQDEHVVDHNTEGCYHHIHFGRPRHRHYHYDGAMEYYRHRPQVYPAPLAPFGQGFPNPPSVDATTRKPAPVFEDSEDVEDVISKNSEVPLSPFSSSTTTTVKPTTPSTTVSTTTSIPAFEKIDLRFGA